MARREVKLIDRAIARCKREAYLAARELTSTDLLAGVNSYAEHTTVTDDYSRAELRMLTNLARRRGAWGLARRTRELQGRR